MNVAIIGAGEIGRALAHVLEQVHASPSFWDADEGKRTGSLEDVVRYARIIFFCVPSHAVETALQDAAPLAAWGSVIVTVSKGLTERGETLDAVFARFVEPKRFVALMGPMLAEELVAGKGGSAVAASVDAAAAQTVQHLFARTAVRIETSRDVRGTMLCGVLKNIYAIGLGCAGELSLGHNLVGRLTVLAVREMAYIIDRLGGARESAAGLAGIGDLLATGLSPDSKNCAFGRALARGEQPGFVSEGSVSLPPLLSLLGGCVAELPLLAGIRDAVVSRKRPADILRGL